jgi:hypothetical protein
MGDRVRIVNMGDWSLTAADESLHEPGPELLWNESYYLDFATPDGELGGYVRLGLYPNWNRAWYWACLVTPGGKPVILADNEVPLPRGDLATEGDGHRGTIETTDPMRAVRVRLAAGGLDLDLEWRTDGGVYGYSLLPRYEVPCRVSGVINGAPFEGYGERDHSWGVRDWWSASWLWSSGRLEDGTYLHGMQANLGMALPWPAFLVPPGGELAHAGRFSVGSDFDGETPSASRLAFSGGPVVTATPIAFAPVTLTSPTGAVAEFPRALCRLSTDDGRAGYGWTEWHQPPGWEAHGWGPLI